MPGDMPGTSKARKVARPNQGNSPYPSQTSAPPTGGSKGPIMNTANNPRQVGKPGLGDNSTGPRTDTRRTIGKATIYPN